MAVDNRRDFVRLRFHGARYSKAQFPVEVLPELSAYRELVMATARALFFAEHPLRKKVPRGFDRSFTLVLSHVDEGSAVPVLATVPQNGMLPLQGSSYFERARDLVEETARRASQNRPIPSEVASKLSGRFGVFGRTLGRGETIFLSKPDEPAREDAPYNRDIRRAIQLSLEDEYWEDITLVGTVTSGDRRTRLFEVSDYDTGQIASFRPLRAREFDDMIEYFTDEPTVVAHGRALYRRDGTLRDLEVDSVSLIEEDLGEFLEAEMPVTDQLTRIAELSPGWLNGEGARYDETTLARVRTMLENLISNYELPRPFIYPTPSIEVRVEWPSSDWDVVITFDKPAASIWLFATAVEGDDEEEATFKPNSDDLARLGAVLHRLLRKGTRP